MSKDRQDQLLEIYKLHAELADRVSQRRDSANRLYVGLLTSLAILLAFFLRFGTETMPVWIGLLAVGVLGVALSVPWFIVIRSYRQLNVGKHRALNELEKKLAYPFFEREWKFLKKGKTINSYWKLTEVESFLPIALFILSLILIIVSICIK